MTSPPFDFINGMIFHGSRVVGEYLRVLGIYWLTDWRTNSSAVAFGLKSAQSWMDHSKRFAR